MPAQTDHLEGFSTLIRATGRPVRFRRHQHIARSGEHADAVLLIVEGWAARYSPMPDGGRHISHFYLPGDICDLGWLVAPTVRQTVSALTPIKALAIECQALQQRMGDDPALAHSVAVDSLHRLDSQTEWMVTLGRRSAVQRLARLLHDLYLRIEHRGRADRGACALPLSQQHLADFTGMSAVHVCRTLRQLKDLRLIDFRRRQLMIPDLAELDARTR